MSLSRLAIGLMSGTSADGIDAALIEISGKGDSPKGQQLKVKLVSFQANPFPQRLQQRILKTAQSKTVPLQEVSQLNFYLGELFAEAAVKICKKAGVSRSKVSVIGSHGQTVCHQPEPRREGRYLLRSTLQIGEPSVIAERTGITTVADFRPRDIAAGGHGAPLTPYFHYLLFHHPRRSVAVNNIGGISNLTFLPAGGTIDKILGFDTGPGNMVMDGIISKISRGKKSHDEGGREAKKGLIDLNLVARLLHHPYFRKTPPKTTGREEFGQDFVDRFFKEAGRRHLKPADMLATVTAFTAVSIAEGYRQFVLKKNNKLDEIIFCGGGVKNRTLMAMIQRELEGVTISTFEDYGLDSGAVEATCFAVLADATLHGWPANIPLATGASRPVVLGKIIPA
ncbi:MAG: anhydro-N-acetylmuramic acid kinase [Deltaproteobacteria bacterium]|nr:anhydro-N-acetylmuramic acid kinase [Deltaproteobacteria bacterium]